MSVYYQVCANHKFSNGKPQLSSLTFHSTSEFYPYLVMSNLTPLSYSRFFHSMPEALHYIDYLFSRYPNCGLSVPVLDASQLSLF